MSGFGLGLGLGIGRGSAGFGPSSVSSQGIWLKPGNYNATSGTWADSSGNSRDATFAGAKPTLNASYQNGKPGVVFNGTTQGLQTPSLPWGTNSVSGITLFVVCSDSTSGTTIIAEHTVDGNTGGGFTLFTNATDKLAGLLSAGNWSQSTANVTLASPAIVTAKFDRSLASGAGGGVGEFLRVAKADVATTPTGGTTQVGANMTNAVMYIGCRAGSSLFWPGTIGELILYTRALSAAEIATVEGYLASAWAL